MMPVERITPIVKLKFKISILNSILCNYSDAYKLAKGTILIAAQAGDNPNNGNKEVVFKNCAPFTDCISEINNTQIENAKDINVVMPMYNLIEYGKNYSKTSGGLWQYFRDKPFLGPDGDTADFPADNNNNTFFKFK